MFRNMVSALIKHERIETTLPKAKELKKIADKMITLGKKGDVNAKRSAMAYLRVSITLQKHLVFPIL
jgi:large subunit ribosomal protein L17